MVDQAPKRAGRDRGRDARTVLLGLAVVLLVWVVVANTQRVQIHFWVVTANTSLIAVILIAAALGAITALLLRRGKKPPTR
jgi:uncharacterized integral membrane protein